MQIKGVLDDPEYLAQTASLLFEVWSYLPNNPQRIHWLGEIVTRDSHRGQGIASALIKHFIALASERGIAELWLYTPDQQQLYRRLGWQEREQLIVTGESVTVMVLQLNER